MERDALRENRQKIFTVLITIFLICATPLLGGFGQSGILKEAVEIAHLPRIIGQEQTIKVIDPELSQAFYGQLQGVAVQYEIHSEKGFLLYANLLVPDLPDRRTDFIAKGMKVKKDGSADLIFILEGKEHEWESFYEPFAGDRYLKGPEYEIKTEPGTYIIEIGNPANAGKYVLSLGKIESFTFAETIHTMKVLPALKRDFFEKSPLSAYFNIVGLFLFVPLWIVLLLIAFMVRMAVRKKKRH